MSTAGPCVRLRHLRDAYGQPYKIFDEVRTAQASPQLSDADKERARRVSSVITTLHIYNATNTNSALK